MRIKEFMFKSVSRGVTIIIAGCMVLFAGLALYIIIEQLESREMENVEAKAHEIKTVLKQSVTFSMSEGITDVEPFTTMFDDIDEIVDVNILPTNIIEDGSEKQFDTVEKSVAKSGQSEFMLEKFGQDEVFRSIVSIPADESCLDCHGANIGQSLAVMSIRYSLKDTYAAISSQRTNATWLFIFAVLFTAISIMLLINKRIIRDVKIIIEYIKALSQGRIQDNIATNRLDEIGEAVLAVNALQDSLSGKADVAAKIAAGNLDVQVDIASDQDELGKAMSNMRDNLVKSCSQREATLIEANKRSEYLNQLEFPVHAMDKEYTIQFINNKAASLAGMNPKECVGKKCYDLFRNEHCQTDKCAVKQAMDQNKSVTEEAYLENQEIYIRYTGIPIHDSEGNIIGAMEQAVDISDIKRIIQSVNQTAGQLSEGQLNARLEIDGVEGDYLNLVDGFNELIENFLEPIEEAAVCFKSIAAGDLSLTMKGEYKGEFNLLKENVNKSIESIKSLVNDVNQLIKGAIEGDLSTRADSSLHQGEFRGIVDGINQTLDAITKPIHEMLNCLNKLADGNLNTEVLGDYRGDYEKMKDLMNATIISFNETLSQVAAIIDQVKDGAVQVSDSSQSVAQGATEQASSLQETSASMTEIHSQTRKNAENAAEANQLAGVASISAHTGDEKMRLMINAMDSINDSSGEISKIIKVIDDIAFQTNLLALNAAVEAARAGVHGKGFAIVADEVRRLAQRSAQAAKETTALIESSKEKVVSGTEIALSTASAFVNIIEGITKVTELVGEIDSSSREQVSGMDQITQALYQIDQVTQSNTASAEESAAASEQLSGQAAYLHRLIAKFKIQGTKQRESIKNNFEPWIEDNVNGAIDKENNGNGNPRLGVGNQNTILLDDSEFGEF